MNKIDQLSSFLNEAPNDPFLHFALAKEYENCGEIEAAIEKYEFLMTRHESYVGTYYHAAKIYEQKLQYEEALACYEKGILIARQARDMHSASELLGAKEQLEEIL